MIIYNIFFTFTSEAKPFIQYISSGSKSSSNMLVYSCNFSLYSIAVDMYEVKENVYNIELGLMRH